MAKYTSNGGHSKKAPGASGILDEVTEDRRVNAAVLKYLKAGGATVHDSTCDSVAPLTGEINLANESGADYAFSIHFNASNGQGTGVECFYHRSKKAGDWAYEMAKKVSAAVAKLLGIKDRGAKKDTESAVGSLGWITKTKMPALLLEVCFVDNKTDAAAYKKVGPDAIGKCIAETLLGKTVSGSGATTQTTNQTTNSSTQTTNTASSFGGKYKVNCSVLNVRDAPTTSGTKVAEYTRGEYVWLDNWYKKADNYIWGRYKGASSGKLRYVAVGKATGKPEPNDYLVKVK